MSDKQMCLWGVQKTRVVQIRVNICVLFCKCCQDLIWVLTDSGSQMPEINMHLKGY